MRLCQMDPFIRFAAEVRSGIMNTAVKVRDCRIFYVEDGQAKLFIDDECCQLEKNSLFYCPGGSIYRIQAQSDLQLVCVNFDLDRSHAAEALPFAVCAKQEQWVEMTAYFQEVEDSSVLNSYLLVQEYIRKNYMQELNNRQIAQLAGYHEYYLNRMFRTYTGMNLHEYLVKIRMEQAAYLMLNTALALNTIAERIGIRSYPHFSACFKNYYGCSPAQYRNRHLEGV